MHSKQFKIKPAREFELHKRWAWTKRIRLSRGYVTTATTRCLGRGYFLQNVVFFQVRMERHIHLIDHCTQLTHLRGAGRPERAGGDQRIVMLRSVVLDNMRRSGTPGTASSELMAHSPVTAVSRS